MGKCVDCRWWERLDDPRARDISMYGKCSWPQPPVIDAIIEALGGAIQIDTTRETYGCSQFTPQEPAHDPH